MTPGPLSFQKLECSPLLPHASFLFNTVDDKVSVIFFIPVGTTCNEEIVSEKMHSRVCSSSTYVTVIYFISINASRDI